jgi:hypothetical protein
MQCSQRLLDDLEKKKWVIDRRVTAYRLRTMYSKGPASYKIPCARIKIKKTGVSVISVAHRKIDDGKVCQALTCRGCRAAGRVD